MDNVNVKLIAMSEDDMLPECDVANMPGGVP